MLSISLQQRLQTQHLSISQLVDDINEYQLRRHPQPGKWSIHDQLAHLARYQEVFAERIGSILEHDGISFSRYVAEEDHDFPAFQQKDKDELIGKILTLRSGINENILLLTSAQLDRRAIHSKFGSLTVTEWIEFFLLHEAHHIFAIFQLKHYS